MNAELPAQVPDTVAETVGTTPGLVVHAGLSRFVGDLGESESAGLGLAVRAGLLFSSSSMVGLGLTHWPSVGRLRRTAWQVEVLQRMSSPEAAVGLRLGAALGRTWSTVRDGEGDLPDGMSAAFGLGAEVVVSSSVVLETDLRVRTDYRGWNGEWRALAGYVVEAPRRAGPRPRTGVMTYWMIPFNGPWELVSPAFGIRTRRRLGERVDAGLTVSVLHWQIPDDTRARGYAWDTRAMVAAIRAGWQMSGRPAVELRAGPVIAAMGEGPDDGVSLGGDAELSFGARLREIPLEAAVGWLWIARSDADNPEDQHGLTLSLALGG